MKGRSLYDQKVRVGETVIGEVKDVEIDETDWRVTHLDIQLTKEAARDLFGAHTSTQNRLSISALKPGEVCCTPAGVELKVSMGQLPLYLRPVS